MTRTRMLLVCLLAISLAGCGNVTARKNITRVINEMVAIENSQLGGIDKKASMRERASAFYEAATAISTLNKKGCPRDFQQVMANYAASLMELSSAQRAVPDAGGELVVQGFLNYLNGEADAGLSRIDGRLNRAIEIAQAARLQVLSVASGHGVIFED